MNHTTPDAHTRPRGSSLPRSARRGPAPPTKALDEVHARQVCVGIPVYNGEQYVVETVESLLAQDYPNLRVIVINNASTDRTKSLLERISDDRFELRTFDDHVPLAENWNRAFEAASCGDYTMVLSADDVLRPRAIRALAGALDGHPDCDVAVGQAVPLNEMEDELLFFWPVRSPDPGVISSLDRHILEHGFNLNINAAMFRRCVEPSFDTDCSLVGDMDLFLRLGRAGRKAVCLKRQVLEARKHPASASSDAEQMWELTLQLLLRAPRTPATARLYRRRMGRTLLWLCTYLIHSRRPDSARRYLEKYRSEVNWWSSLLILIFLTWPKLTRAPVRLRSLVMRERSMGEWQRFFPPGTRVLALPSWEAPRLFIPALSPAQRWRRSAFYPAFKPAARAFRFLLRVRATLLMAPTRRASLHGWLLEDFTRDVLPEAVSASVLVGTPGPSQKITVQLWDASNQIVGYLKYGEKPLSQGRISHEYSVLARLPEGVGPAPLKFGPCGDGMALLTAPLQGRKVPVQATPDERMVAYSHQLITGPPVPLDVHPWVRTRESTSDIACYLDALSDRPWPVAAQHGDFVPWNLIQSPDGTIKAYDWEFGRTDGFPFLDLAYYVLQVAALFDLADPAEAAAHARAYLVGASSLDLTPKEANAIVGLAAYEAHQGFLASGGRPDDAEIRWWQRIWEDEK